MPRLMPALFGHLRDRQAVALAQCRGTRAAYRLRSSERRLCGLAHCPWRGCAGRRWHCSHHELLVDLQCNFGDKLAPVLQSVSPVSPPPAWRHRPFQDFSCLGARCGSACPELIPEPRMFTRARAAQGQLRRRDHRRRRARPGGGLLPGARPRHHQRRGAREGLHRRRQHRPQHHHHPLELPHARRREVLRRSVRLWQDLSERASTSTCSIPRAATTRSRTPTRRCAPCAGAPRSTSTSAWTANVVDAEAVAARAADDGPDLRRARARSWARCTTRPARSRGTTRWPGATARGADRRGVEIHQQHRSHRHRRRGRQGGRRAHRRAASSRRARCCARWPAPRRASPTMVGPAHARSTSIRCRPWSPSR